MSTTPAHLSALESALSALEAIGRADSAPAPIREQAVDAAASLRSSLVVPALVGALSPLDREALHKETARLMRDGVEGTRAFALAAATLAANAGQATQAGEERKAA